MGKEIRNRLQKRRFFIFIALVVIITLKSFRQFPEPGFSLPPPRHCFGLIRLTGSLSLLDLVV